MSVFEYGEPTDETEVDGSHSEELEDATQESDTKTKSVTVMESSNGNGYSRCRIYIPSEFADDLGISGGDALLLHLDESTDEMSVQVP